MSSEERRQRLEALVADHLDRAARIIRVLGAPVEELEDLVHQAFSITAERLPVIDPGKESAFLVETAVRLAANARRKRAQAREIPAAGLPEIAEDRPSPEELADRQRALGVLDRVLDKMDEDLRTVLVLCEIEQMTMAEVAVAIGAPPGTVASRLRRAREEFLAGIRRLGFGAETKGGRR
jgi:RNA polymerase sigma-70 factor (ECF subfamily)